MTSLPAPQPIAQAECSQPPTARTFPVHHHPTSPAPNLRLRLEALLVYPGTGIDPATGTIATPIHLSIAYGHPGLGKSTGYDYTRTANPTHDALQDALVRLEGGMAAFTLSLGMAALGLVTRTLAPHGSRIVVLRDLYDGSFRFLGVLVEEGAADVDSVLSLEGLRGALADLVDLVIIETPMNPMMEEISIPEMAELAHAAGAKLVVDNTFYTPAVRRPLELGADVVVHSGTKYLGGHNDVMAGVTVVVDNALAEQLNYRFNTTGVTLGSSDCFPLLCGLKTLVLHMERHEANATATAQFLRSSPYVTWVLYPGYSGMVSLNLAESAGVARFLAPVRVFISAESLGGVGSLMMCPSVQVHVDTSVEVRVSCGLTDRLMRLGVGIKYVNDPTADLAQAFGAAHT